MRRSTRTTSHEGSLRLREPGVPDFDVLVNLAGQKTAQGAGVLAAIADDLFGSGKRILHDRERALMHDVLRRLVVDVERSLRRRLAERMADFARPPHGLAAVLAASDAKTVHPILLARGGLRDPGLVEAVKHRTQAYLLASYVNKRLVENIAGDPEAEEKHDIIATLLTNAGATISRGVTEYLVAESRRLDTFQNPLVLRCDLPLDVTDRLYWRVAAALRRQVRGLAPVDREALDDAVEAAVGDALASARDDLDRPTATEALIDGLVRCGALDEGLLVQMLRQGDVSLFEAGIARLVGVSPNLIGRLLYEPGGEGLAVACRAAGFARETLTTIFDLTRPVCLPHDASGTGNVARVEGFFSRIPRETASAALRHWRRNPGYLCAMRLVDGR